MSRVSSADREWRQRKRGEEGEKKRGRVTDHSGQFKKKHGSDRQAECVEHYHPLNPNYFWFRSWESCTVWESGEISWFFDASNWESMTSGKWEMWLTRRAALDPGAGAFGWRETSTCLLRRDFKRFSNGFQRSRKGILWVDPDNEHPSIFGWCQLSSILSVLIQIHSENKTLSRK